MKLSAAQHGSSRTNLLMAIAIVAVVVVLLLTAAQTLRDADLSDPRALAEQCLC